jgi:hypothetical protein
VAQFVEALHYKQEGHGFCKDGVIDIILPAALGSTQPLTEMSIRNVSWRIKAAAA